MDAPERPPGRPALPESERRKPIALTLSPEVIEGLSELATREGLSRSQAVEKALEYWLSRDSNEITTTARQLSWAVALDPSRALADRVIAALYSESAPTNWQQEVAMKLALAALERMELDRSNPAEIGRAIGELYRTTLEEIRKS